MGRSEPRGETKPGDGFTWYGPGVPSGAGARLSHYRKGGFVGSRLLVNVEAARTLSVLFPACRCIIGVGEGGEIALRSTSATPKSGYKMSRVNGWAEQSSLAIESVALKELPAGFYRLVSTTEEDGEWQCVFAMQKEEERDHVSEE